MGFLDGVLSESGEGLEGDGSHSSPTVSIQTSEREETAVE